MALLVQLDGAVASRLCVDRDVKPYSLTHSLPPPSPLGVAKSMMI